MVKGYGKCNDIRVDLSFNTEEVLLNSVDLDTSSNNVTNMCTAHNLYSGTKHISLLS